MGNRVGGTIALQIDGELYETEGSFNYNLGRPKREALLNSQKTVGYKEMAQTPFIEGNIFALPGLDYDRLLNAKDITATLSLPNEATVVLREAWFASEGTGETENGTLAVRFEAKNAEVVN